MAEKLQPNVDLSRKLIEANRVMGFSAMLNGTPQGAVKHYEEMERIAGEIGDDRLAGEAAYVVGMVNLKMERNLDAFKAFERAGRIAADLQDSNLEAHAISSQLGIYVEMKEEGAPIDAGKFVALQVRLEAIPEEKIEDDYQPSWLYGSRR